MSDPQHGPDVDRAPLTQCRDLLDLHVVSPKRATAFDVGVETPAWGKLGSLGRREAVHRSWKVPRGIKESKPSAMGGFGALPTTRQLCLPTLVAFPRPEARVLGIGQTCFPNVSCHLHACVRLQATGTSRGAEGSPDLRRSWVEARLNEDGTPVGAPVGGGSRS